MRHLLIILLLLPALAGGMTVTLVPPSTPVAPASLVDLDLLAVNPSSGSADFVTLGRIPGRLHSAERSWPVELLALDPEPAALPPRGFDHRTYRLAIPSDARGRLILDIPDTPTGPLRAVLDITQATTELPPSGTQLSPLRDSGTAIAQLRRSFVDRFAEHDPVYFIYGPDDPAAKFQFSFKYRLFNLGDPESSIAPERTLQFGYTQRALWDIDDNSSPFYDTSYMPSLFFESLAPANRNGSRFTWLGWQGGYQHESNGKDGADSRSLDTLFVRSGLAFGDLGGWHLILSPRFRVYLDGLDNNPRIKDYRGHAEWIVTLGKNDGPSLTYTGWSGKDFDHFTTQLDLTIPLRLKIVDFGTYLLIQYYSGYGESLLDYDRRSETVRVGISLVR